MLKVKVQPTDRRGCLATGSDQNIIFTDRQCRLVTGEDRNGHLRGGACNFPAIAEITLVML